MDRAGDVGVDIDVDARVSGFGAECPRCFAADALQFEAGDRDGDGVDGGVEPCRERARRGERALGEVRAVEWDENAAVDWVRCSMGF